MKKTPNVWFSLCLMLAVFASAATYTTASGVTFENGCLSGNWYFHLECDDDAKKCELSQHKTTSPTTEDFQCWYDNSAADLISALNTDKTYYTLSVSSSIDLGGYDESSDLCVMDFSPITANYSSFDGSNNTIDGFCYVTTGDVGFFKSRSNEVKDIAFKNAYVNGTGKAGVIASSIGSATLTNVTVDGATIVGDNAGSIAGYAYNFTLRNSTISNVNVSGSVVGGAFGAISHSSGDGWTAEYNTFSGNNVIKGTSIAGGFIGSARISSKYNFFDCNYSTIKVDVLLEVSDNSYSGNLFAGGAIGYIETSASEYNYVNLKNDTFKGSVKVLTKDVTGNVYVGGLVGFANNSYYASPSLEGDKTTSEMNVDVDLGSVEGNVSVGGVFGYALEYSSYGGFATTMRNASVESDVKVTTDNVKGNVSVGGVFGNIENNGEFNTSHFKGSVSYKTSHFDSQSFLYMGSIWGNANSASLELQYTYSLGSISYSGVDANQANVGYFGGYSDKTESNRRVRNNYYYSQDDDIAVGIGNYTESEWGIGTAYETSTCQNCLYIEDNARNAVSNGDIDHAEGHRNQIYSDAEMKTIEFAYRIGKGAWTQYGDALPGFPTDDNWAICEVAIDISSFNQDIKDEIKSKYDVVQDSARIYTDSKGKLKDEDVTYFNSLLKDGDYWNGPAPLLTSSTYIGNVGYGYKTSGKWNVVYHFRVRNDNDYNVFDVNQEIWSPFKPVDGYDIDFMSDPVDSFMSGDYSTRVPVLHVVKVDVNNTVDPPQTTKHPSQLLYAKAILVENNTDGEPSMEYLVGDTAFEKNNRFYDLVNSLGSELLHNGLNIGDYKNTLHVIYEYSENNHYTLSMEAVPTANGGAVDVKITPYLYDGIGNAQNALASENVSTDNSGTTIAAGTKDVDVATGYKIELNSVPLGYSKEKYSLYFGYVPYSTNQERDTLLSSDNYLIDPLAFGEKYGYQKHVWKRENVSKDDLILLDSIYKGVKRAEVLYEMNRMKMSIVPVPIDYNITFDIEGTETITAYDANNNPLVYDFEIYVTKDFSVPKSYDLEMPDFKLPEFYAVSQNVPDNMSTVNKTYKSVWTSKPDENRCEADGYYCVSTSMEAFNEFNLQLITLANTYNRIVEEEGKNPSIAMYPAWADGATSGVSHVIVTCDGNDVVCANESPLVLVLSQKFEINGVEKNFEHRSSKGKSAYDSPTIPLPQNAGELQFDVAFEARPGFEIDASNVKFEDIQSGMNQYIVYDKDNSKLAIDASTGDNLQIQLKNWTYTLNEYTVSFDLKPMYDADEYVVLGNSWAGPTKTMDLSAEHNAFPKVYIGDDAGTQKIFGVAEWSPVQNVGANGPYYSSLTSKLLEGVGSTSEFKMYPFARIAHEAGEIQVVAHDKTGNALTDISDYQGNVVLTQSVDETIAFNQPSSACDLLDVDGSLMGKSHCLYIPDLNDTLKFKVSLVQRNGYTMALDDPAFEWTTATSSNKHENYEGGFGYRATDSVLVIAPSLMKNMQFNVKYTVTGPFYVTYDLNTNAEDEGNLFFPIDASSSGKFEFDETVVSTDLWVPYRSDKCFDGWSVVTQYNPAVPASEPPKIMTLYADYAASALSLDPDAPTELQANWKDCGASQPAAGVMIASGDTTAKVMLKQVFDGVEYEHLLGSNAFELPANMSGYKFFIDSANSVVDLGYEAVGINVKYSVNGIYHEVAIEGDSIVVGKSNVSDFLVTMETQVALNGKQFWINGNADTVFYGSSITMLEVEAQKDEPITTDVYRVGYKLKGWSFEKTSTQTHLEFGTDFEDDYIKFAKAYGRLPDTLYAVWETDADAGVKRVVNKSRDVSSFRLMQDLSGQAFDYLVSDSLLLPAEGLFEFRVEMIYDSNEIEVDDRRAIVVLDEDGELDEILENYVHFTVEKSIGLKANILKDKRVQFVLNENSEDQVFFGSDWVDTLATENPDSALVLPTIAYNSAKCLAGWTIDSTSNKLLTVLDKDLLNDLRAKGNAQGRSISELLYAKWTTNLDSCAGDFMKLAIEQENGSVWFVEDDKDKTIKRDFTDEGTMFVPLEMNGHKFRVQASGVDTSVYVLDSLVVLRSGSVDTVLFVGDLMPEVLDSSVSLKAYFGWKNKTKLEIVKSRLDSSGSMFKLSFKASDFEVRRHVSALMEIYDTVKDSVVRSFALGDSVVMGYDTAFVFPMRKPGNYRMVVTLEDQTGLKDTLSRDFSVDPEIASVAADSWQMLSLSAVDMSSIKKDGDQVFYWWDEQGLGEFWQYKRLDLNEPVDATVGVWYNSLEGRPLVVRDDLEDEENDFVWKLDSANTGWNLVANPHGWAVDLFANYPEMVKDVDEESEVMFYKWNAEEGHYDPVYKSIGPYEAVWVQVSEKTDWKVSADPYFPPDAAPLEKRALAKASTKDRWTLQVKLSDKNGKQDSWNILGAGLNPVDADEPPEGMGDHVNLSIVEGKRALAKSIKEASDEMEWTVALSASNDRVGYLTIDGIDGVKAYGYRVFVTVDGNTTEMQEGMPLKVYLKSTAKTATVRVAPAARTVAKNMLKGLRTARLGNRLQVTFDATGLAGTNARVDILDMKGHVISTVTAKTLEGANALVLDAPQTGLYMLRVRAGSQQQAAKIMVQ